MASSLGSSRRGTNDPISLSQAIVLATGVIFTLVGILGFAVTGASTFADAHSGDTLLGFEVNPLHNVVHLAIGVTGLLMWRTNAMARTYGWLLFGVYGITFVYGLFTVNSTSGANFLSLNGPDNALHLAFALVGLATAVLARSTRTFGLHGRHGRATPA